MKSPRVFIDSFESVPRPKAKTTYEEFRQSVLDAGKFSAFEATHTPRMAGLFTRLCRDPLIETDNSCGYPWTLVWMRDAPKEAALAPSGQEVPRER